MPRFFFGKVCFAEHFASCTAWAMVAPIFALAVGCFSFWLPWQRWLQHSRVKVAISFVAGRTPCSGWCKPALDTLLPSLLISPLLTVLGFTALCPLCARPQSTVWETLEYTLWPPTQLIWGHTSEVGGRALAIGVTIIVEHGFRFALNTACRSTSDNRVITFTRALVPFAGACALGALLLWRSTGPGVWGCFVVASATLGACKLARKLFKKL